MRPTPDAAGDGHHCLNRHRRSFVRAARWYLVIAAVVLSATVATGQTITRPRDLLALYGADTNLFDKFVNGRPVTGEEVESLLTVLFAARRFSAVEIDRWTNRDTSLEQLAAAPGESAGDLYHYRGVIESVAAERPEESIADRFELPRYYRCQIHVRDFSAPVVVYAINIPRAWGDGSSVPRLDRVSFDGFFIKLAGDMDDPQPAFAAKRIAWHPATPLGDLGMDVGRLEGIRNTTRTPIIAAEREGFYQLLDCVERADNGQLLRQAAKNVRRLAAELQKQDARPQVAENAVELALFNHPERHHGELFLIEGTARRTTLIRVADADIVERMKIDHYYQMEVFTAGSQGNPMVICLRELPPGMPQGDNIYEAVRIPAFFFKKWAYRVPASVDAPQPGEPSHRLQLAPLLIARTGIWLPAPPNNPWDGLFTGLLILLLLAAICWAVWRYTRGDRQFRGKRIAPLFEPEVRSLNELGFDSRDKPDFNGLG